MRQAAMRQFDSYQTMKANNHCATLMALRSGMFATNELSAITASIRRRSIKQSYIE
jgi:hypothetical protein